MPVAGEGRGRPRHLHAAMIVIVYGYEGSGPGHWQRWLHDELRRRGAAVAFPELAAPSEPHKDMWVAELAAVLARATTPITFVCHSLGCWAVDHLLAAHGAASVHAALLVAPPSPFLIFEPVASFLPPPRNRDAWAPIAARTLLVGSDNDDYNEPGELASLAAHLGVGCEIVPGAGHINVDAGYGPWPFALEWLARVGAL
jgi:predicted alpha/beta hydrolase family esterase